MEVEFLLDAEDGYTGRERWSYLLLADELRRWPSKNGEDRKELFRRMVFNAMVTNNDDHPRYHALLCTAGGWRLSPAYDIVPVPLISQERRDLALTAGAHGKAVSQYNLLSRCDAFGLSLAEATAILDSVRTVVSGWRECFNKMGVESRSIEHIAPVMLCDAFYRTEPVQAP